MLPSRVSVPFPRTFYRPAFYPSRISLSFLLSLLLPRLSLSLVCSRSRGSCDDWRIYGLLLRRAFISSECKLRSRAALHVLLVDTYRWLQRGGDRPREKELLSSGFWPVPTCTMLVFVAGCYQRCCSPLSIPRLSFSPSVRLSTLIFSPRFLFR